MKKKTCRICKAKPGKHPSYIMDKQGYICSFACYKLRKQPHQQRRWEYERSRNYAGFTFASFRWLKAQTVTNIKKYKLKVDRAIRQNELPNYYDDGMITKQLRMIDTILKHRRLGTNVNYDHSWCR